MYNGIGLTTPRGSGTNGFVIRNLSAVRKTKEKVRDYKEKEDLAVRPFDIELIEHERRRQAEVRCLELQELLEEKNIPEDEIQEKVSAFRAKLLAEKKSGPRDASGRPILRDSHELAMAQEEKNEKAKSAFGISDDFVPGSSYDRSKVVEKDKTLTPVPTLEVAKKDSSKPVEETKVEKEKMKKKKKSHKRRASSSSSSSSSSEEESRRKKRRKEKKKKSKKSHSHHHHKSSR